ncbi:DISARM system phospholipase D-like protein DrmC [Halomicronema sp. CCY15110]|uniref:DISARM system phospholipase D-like protein DrmC n=1 Tax=Halomicronema sp. CCY15110 TaxID=2767773 RepID=UPI00194F1902|nr:DISARM system phospholipase D-like protein DrmC [Halomicronema sp. CCY15110]
MSPFLKLSRPALLNIAEALATGRLSLPASAVALYRYVVDDSLPSVMAELNQLYHQGMAIDHIAYMLRLMAAERAQSQAQQDQVGLVWTGPEVPGTESRDTGIVVRELFSSAQSSVLISSFSVDQGPKGHALFRPLAERMDANPDLQVRMFLNVKRKYQDTTPASVLVRKFAETFRNHVWPGQRLPEVFHDPRTMLMSADSNACLHAKCVVVDEARCLITSANFSEAAHERNIEAGVLMTDKIIARAIRSQYEMLVDQGDLMRVPGL